MRWRVQSLDLLSGLRSGIAMSCDVGCRRGSDPSLLWLWCRQVATALIRPLAWDPPYAAGSSPLTKNIYIYYCSIVDLQCCVNFVVQQSDLYVYICIYMHMCIHVFLKSYFFWREILETLFLPWAT